MTGVFLGYRRIDRSYAPMFVQWVLLQRFGDGLVFEAGQQNQPAVHFPSSIEDGLERCSLLVVFIDPPWLNDIDMLRNPHDWVRKEILYFVEHNKPILPVLLDGAEMPHSSELPPELGPMTKWIGLPMSPTRAHADMQRLVGRIEQVAPDLVLAALREPVPAAATPAALLRAEHEVFPFRLQTELADLIDWVRASDGPRVRQVVGPSGAGKSRLALRLHAELSGAGHPTVLLPISATPEALDRLGLATTPFLVIIDDAETRPATVAAAIRAVATTMTPARVLLLARGQSRWQDHLRDDPDDRIDATLNQATTLPLLSQSPQTGDFAIALAALGARLGVSVSSPAAAPPQPTTLLELQAAALVSLLPEGPAQEGPWPRLAGIERDRWTRTATAGELPHLRHDNVTEIVAAVTLFGAATESEADALITSLRAFRGAPLANADAGRALARTMLPGPQALNPLEPQPLADEFIAQLLCSGYRLSSLLDAVTDDQAWNAISALGRCLAGHSEIGDGIDDLFRDAPARLLPLAMTALATVPDPAPLVARMSEALPHIPVTELDRVANALPLRSDALAEFAVDVTTRALIARQDAGQADEVTATLSRLLAIRLAARGGPAPEAVAAARAAVEWFTAVGPDRAESYAALALAFDLNPVTTGEAIEAGAQAITLFRDAATDDRTQAALATALINQAHRSAGDRASAAEAYRILGSLHESRPYRYRSLYADATDLLAALTRGEQLGREALRLRQSLAKARPDAYRPSLAATLFNLGLILGPGEESRSLWQEAEMIFTDLAAVAPERFGADLARVRARLTEARQ